MASLVLTGDTSGQITISAPAVAGTTTLTLPATTGTVLNDATVGVCRAWVNFNGTGTVAIPSLGITNTTFTNATQTTLQTGDIVATTTLAGTGTTVVIALFPRDPGIDQENLPVGSIDVGFPIKSSVLPNPITLGNNDYLMFNDPNGDLGLGSDLIAGNSLGESGGNINALSRQTAISYSIGTPPTGTQPATFLLKTGDLIKFKTNTFTRRDKVTGVWTDWAETATASIVYSGDPVFNHIFFYAVGATGGPFFFINGTTGTVTALGSMGVGVSNAFKDNLLRITIKDSIILMQKDDGTNYYLYSSAAGTNFVRSAVGIGANIFNTRPVTSDYYDLASYTIISDLVWVHTHNSSTGVTTSLNTGIDTSLTSGNPKNIVTGWHRYGNIDYFLCRTLGVEIDPTLVAGRYYLCVYAHNAGATTRIYTDGANYGVNSSNGHIIGKVTNSLRFAGFYDTVGTYLYSITLT